MKTYLWKGFSAYQYFVQANEAEMRALADYHHIDWRFFHDGPARTIPSEDGPLYFFFVNEREKKIALLPSLSIAFGGQYNDDSPIGEEVPLSIDLRAYSLEPFRFHG